jgi:tubulin-specific chaperone A
MSSLNKTLSIKVNVVRRVTKELQMYRKEADVEIDKVQKMRDDDVDPYDIKYASNVLNECLAMVPDTEQRLESAIRDLQSFLDENADELELIDGSKEEIEKARVALTDGEAEMNKTCNVTRSN